MATLNLSRLKERLVKALTPWFLGREQDALIEAMKTAGEETLLAVDVDTAALQAQLTNLYSNAGADAVGIADAGGYYTGTSVEDALQEVGGLIGGVAPVTSVFGRLGAVVAQSGDYTKAQVGLGNVDNTSDVNKPVSTAQQTALNLKANIASPTFTGTVSGITATMVGLGNVNNTSDLNKPVSTATQTALNLKANLASPTFTGTVSGITKTMVGLGNVDNTTDLNKPVSTATQTALNLKANLASPSFTGTVTAAGSVVSNGASAGFTFLDRTTSRTWLWYGSTDTAYLWNGSANIVSVSPTGIIGATQYTVTGAGSMYNSGGYILFDAPTREYSTTPPQRAGADLVAWFNIPRVFVQATDPAGASADGDLWFW